MILLQLFYFDMIVMAFTVYVDDSDGDSCDDGDDVGDCRVKDDDEDNDN